MATKFLIIARPNGNLEWLPADEVTGANLSAHLDMRPIPFEWVLGQADTEEEAQVVVDRLTQRRQAMN